MEKVYGYYIVYSDRNGHYLQVYANSSSGAYIQGIAIEGMNGFTFGNNENSNPWDSSAVWYLEGSLDYSITIPALKDYTPIYPQYIPDFYATHDELNTAIANIPIPSPGMSSSAVNSTINQAIAPDSDYFDGNEFAWFDGIIINAIDYPTGERTGKVYKITVDDDGQLNTTLVLNHYFYPKFNNGNSLTIDDGTTEYYLDDSENTYFAVNLFEFDSITIEDDGGNDASSDWETEEVGSGYDDHRLLLNCTNTGSDLHYVITIVGDIGEEPSQRNLTYTFDCYVNTTYSGGGEE